MATNTPPSSGFPPSMGPGGRPLQPGESMSVGDTARAIQEMRSHYQIRVEPTELKVSYDLNSQTRGFTVPFDAMPMGGTWKWLMYGGKGRAYVTGAFYLDTIRGVENMAQRRLTQREAEGFAFHTAKRMQYAMAGSAASIAGGFGMAAWGYKTMKFPFRPVKPIEAYDVFPAERLAILKGQYARIAWQITRLNIYIALTMILVNPFFRSMGDSVMTVGLFKDERTNAIVKEVKGSFDRIRMNRPSSGQQRPAPTPAGEQTMEESNAQEFYAKDSSSDSYYGNSSDYSSGGNTFTDNTTDTGALNDSAMRSRESRQPSPNSFSKTRYDQAASPNQQPSSSFFGDDDASPTAGNDSDMYPSSRSQNQASNTGSVWDRYRRGAASPPSPSPSSQSSPYPSPSNQSQSTRPTQEIRGTWRSSRAQGQSQDFETRGDSFSFSNSDEDRALAKEQAQREFNEMLERERRESGSGDYEGGSFAAENGMEDAGQGKGSGSAWDRRRR